MQSIPRQSWSAPGIAGETRTTRVPVQVRFDGHSRAAAARTFTALIIRHLYLAGCKLMREEDGFVEGKPVSLDSFDCSRLMVWWIGFAAVQVAPKRRLWSAVDVLALCGV